MSARMPGRTGETFIAVVALWFRCLSSRASANPVQQLARRSSARHLNAAPPSRKFGPAPGRSVFEQRCPVFDQCLNNSVQFLTGTTSRPETCRRLRPVVVLKPRDTGSSRPGVGRFAGDVVQAGELLHEGLLKGSYRPGRADAGGCAGRGTEGRDGQGVAGCVESCAEGSGKIPVGTGEIPASRAIPSKGGPFPVVFVVQDLRRPRTPHPTSGPHSPTVAHGFATRKFVQGHDRLTIADLRVLRRDDVRLR
jgi:hypothetical protein